LLGSEEAVGLLTAMNKRSSGFTLIEMMITLAVMALLFMIGLPSMNTWLQNTQLRASAESMQAGLQLARAEALRRNVPVRFQLVDAFTAGCVLSNSGSNWIISLNDPTGLCQADPSDTAAPLAIQKRSGAEGSPNAAVSATNGGGAATTVTFTGLGRVIGVGPITQIDITNPSGGVCQPAGPMRCLRINIASGGQVRMCDPAVVDPTDPRLCN
jgi:type IV fimbrial biogenesis protein FimT